MTQERMTEFTLTLAENGYILDYNEPQPTRLEFEGGNGLPLRLMNELLGDVTDLIDSGECEKIKLTINVENYDTGEREEAQRNGLD